jgi:hypothetical protein
MERPYLLSIATVKGWISIETHPCKSDLSFEPTLQQVLFSDLVDFRHQP